MQEGLDLDGVTIDLADRTLIAITHRVRPGDVLTVMGPSGSGKSTLLAYIGGFLDPAFAARGRVAIDGEDITGQPAENRHVGILFQDPLLFPHMSVEQNLLFAIPADITPMARRRETAAAALAALEALLGI